MFFKNSSWAVGGSGGESYNNNNVNGSCENFWFLMCFTQQRRQYTRPWRGLDEERSCQRQCALLVFIVVVVVVVRTMTGGTFVLRGSSGEHFLKVKMFARELRTYDDV